MNSSGCVYMPDGASRNFFSDSITVSVNEIDKSIGVYHKCRADMAKMVSQVFEEPLQQLKQTVMEKTQKPFEMQITFPANRTDIFTTTKYGVTVEVAVVSAERAKEIYDVIGRQLAGLRATEPKKPAKKTKPKAKRK